jgi:hypothetical protein
MSCAEAKLQFAANMCPAIASCLCIRASLKLAMHLPANCGASHYAYSIGAPYV